MKRRLKPRESERMPGPRLSIPFVLTLLSLLPPAATFAASGTNRIYGCSLDRSADLTGGANGASSKLLVGLARKNGYYWEQFGDGVSLPPPEYCYEFDHLPAGTYQVFTNHGQGTLSVLSGDSVRVDVSFQIPDEPRRLRKNVREIVSESRSGFESLKDQVWEGGSPSSVPVQGMAAGDYTAKAIPGFSECFIHTGSVNNAYGVLLAYTMTCRIRSQELPIYGPPIPSKRKKRKSKSNITEDETDYVAPAFQGLSSVLSAFPAPFRGTNKAPDCTGCLKFAGWEAVNSQFNGAIAQKSHIYLKAFQTLVELDVSFEAFAVKVTSPTVPPSPPSAGGAGPLPPPSSSMDPGISPGTARISFKNETPYSLTITIFGQSGLFVAPYSSGSTYVPAGYYNISVKASSPNVLPWQTSLSCTSQFSYEFRLLTTP